MKTAKNTANNPLSREGSKKGQIRWWIAVAVRTDFSCPTGRLRQCRSKAKA